MLVVCDLFRGNTAGNKKCYCCYGIRDPGSENQAYEWSTFGVYFREVIPLLSMNRYSRRHEI